MSQPASCPNAHAPKFYLGTHKPHWLWTPGMGETGLTEDIPLFVSYRRLLDKATWKPAVRDWALDSGGFSELVRNPRWTTGPREYCEAVARAQREIGRMAWAAPQDYMCEPGMISGGQVGKVTAVGTGLSVGIHQHLTMMNYVTLVNLWPEYSDAPCPFIPVLQGWALHEYIRCAELYRAAGIDLTQLPVVGLGSVCRRQDTFRIGYIAGYFAENGIRLHGFGVKVEGLELYGRHLASCDSASWSYDAYRLGRPAFGGCTHQTCSNCPRYAAQWYRDHAPREALGLAS
jgi:hypothetical protein